MIRNIYIILLLSLSFGTVTDIDGNGLLNVLDVVILVELILSGNE